MSLLRPGWERFRVLVAKDLRVELRRREGLATLATFVLLVALVFALAFDPSRRDLSPLVAGMAWVAYYFAAVLLFGRGFAREVEQGTLDGLLLAPLDRGLVYLAKVVAHIIVLGALELLLTPVILAWLGFRGNPAWGGLLLAMVLGTVGLAATGTLLGALTASVRGRELLLPVVLFPLTAPVLLAGVEAATAALAGRPEDAALWFRLLGVYDTMFLVVSSLLFDFVVTR